MGGCSSSPRARWCSPCSPSRRSSRTHGWFPGGRVAIASLRDHGVGGPLESASRALDGALTVAGFTSLTGVAFVGLVRDRALLIAALVCATAGPVAEVLKRLFGASQLHLAVTGLDEGTLPSGHTAFATAAFGLLALVVRRRALAAVAASAPVAVGLARVLMGAHWPSDLVAGWLLGGAIVLVALIVSAVKASSGGLRHGPGGYPHPKRAPAVPALRRTGRTRSCDRSVARTRLSRRRTVERCREGPPSWSVLHEPSAP